MDHTFLLCPMIAQRDRQHAADSSKLKHKIHPPNIEDRKQINSFISTKGTNKRCNGTCVIDGYSTCNPSAPPLAVWSESVQGYEHTTGFRSVCLPPPPDESRCPSYLIGVPPPPYEEAMRDGGGNEQTWGNTNPHAYNPSSVTAMDQSPQKLENKTPTISEEEAYEALSKFVSSNRCYGRGLPKHMKTKEIRTSNGYQYILETFYEERSTSWKQEPYINQVIDGPSNGVPPVGWDICVPPPEMFQTKQAHQEVPHTASVNPCPRCKGKGTSECTACKGSGDIKCSVCDGLGLLFQHNCQDGLTGFEDRSNTAPRICHHCSGGRKSCTQCSGSGKSTCKTCLGHCQVKTFIRLTVKWKVLQAQRVFTRTKLPDDYVCRASGTTVFEEQNEMVYPLLDFTYNDMNSFSRKMIISHREQVKHARILMQRHFVREVPIAEVLTEWKNKDFMYWVYGKDHQVYCPDYPSKCCLL